MKRFVIHIVPHLPPQNSGVGDYATLVGRRMEELGGDVICGYVAAGHNAVDLPTNSPKIRNITGCCDPHSLWRAVEELGRVMWESGKAADQQNSCLAVVLNYSGYGYERNGCPDWFLEALRRRPAWVGRVVTFFHELYATGRPWQRAFWYSSRQRRITAEIARRRDAVLTNRAESARWLEEATGLPAGSVASLPVPSNVGEPAATPSFNARPMRAVTFGNPRGKCFALVNEAAAVATILRRLEIQELVDIGSPAPVERADFERFGIAVRQLGYLPAADVSRELEQCRLGFVEYPLFAAAKSGVFAAYAAHGVVPVLKSARAASEDALAFGTHCFSFDEAECLNVESLRLASQRIVEWYGRHNIEQHATAIHAACSEVS